jgi:predicted nucleic acid-binding OB-fold protein
MSNSININTASLKNIKNIGQKRASSILEAREKKSFLTLEYNLGSFILMQAHDIIIERPRPRQENKRFIRPNDTYEENNASVRQTSYSNE